MTVWVYPIAEDLPGNWDIAVNNKLWASPHTREVVAGDLLVFRQPVGARGRTRYSKIVGVARAAADGQQVGPRDELPWDDRFGKDGVLIQDQQKIDLTDIRMVEGVEVTWPNLIAALNLNVSTPPFLPAKANIDEDEALEAINALVVDGSVALSQSSTFAATASSLYLPGSLLFFGNCTNLRADEFLSTGSFEVDANEWTFDGNAAAGSIIVDLDEDERVVSAWILRLDLDEGHNWKRTDTFRSNRAWTVDEVCRRAGLPRADSYRDEQTKQFLDALDLLAGERPSITREEGQVRTTQCRRRDADLAFARKELDGWRCQGCERRPEDEYGSTKARRALHSHHLLPMAIADDVSRGGLRTTSTKDLVSLCANCHSFVHSEAEPLTIKQLRAALNVDPPSGP